MASQSAQMNDGQFQCWFLAGHERRLCECLVFCNPETLKRINNEESHTCLSVSLSTVTIVCRTGDELARPPPAGQQQGLLCEVIRGINGLWNVISDCVISDSLQQLILREGRARETADLPDRLPIDLSGLSQALMAGEGGGGTFM